MNYYYLKIKAKQMIREYLRQNVPVEIIIDVVESDFGISAATTRKMISNIYEAEKARLLLSEKAAKKEKSKKKSKNERA